MNGADAVSSRARRLIKPPLPYVAALVESLGNQYDAQTNPDGHILMAVAENKLCAPMLREKMLTNLQSDAVRSNTALMNYTSPCGLPSFRASLAKFLSKRVFGGHEVDPNQLVVGAGCVSGLITLSLLLFEDGDSVLIPAPYYPAFDHDFKNFGGVEVQPVHCDPCAGAVFGRVTESALQRGFDEAVAAGHPPKAVLLSNPCNPLGSLSGEDELMSAVAFCAARGLHLIMDEIYALSVFPQHRADFVSVVTLLRGALGDRVHWLWSFSKDFGASGLRAGVLYSQNAALLAAVGATNDVMMMSNLTQVALQAFTDDEAFVDEYLTTNAQRLQEAYATVSQGLHALGIAVLPAQGAIFAFADLSGHLAEHTFAAELALFHRLRAHGVLLTPGHSCHCPRPGFFRVCYAFVASDALTEAIRRIGVALEMSTNPTN